jgi:hypothetical protein
MSAALPWVVHHAVTELGRAPSLEAGKAMADRHQRNGVATVMNAATGERWIRVAEKWRPMAGSPNPALARARFAREAAGELGRQQSAASRARLPYRDD